MNRKNLPLLMMLVAGAVTCIINLVRNYTILGQLTSLLISLVVFYFLGCLLKWTLDHFDNQNEMTRKELEATEEDAEGADEEGAEEKGAVAE